MGNRYALSLLEERWIRVGPTQVVEREEVAKRLRCQGGGTPEASCDFDLVWGLYDRRGHPQARFSLRRIEDRDGHAQHEVVVDEGPYFWVERVRVDGMEELPAARAWTDALPLRAGGPFSVYVYMQNKDELLAALHGAGHGRAEVFERMEPDLRASVPGSYAVVARYDVDPGRPGERWPLGELEFWEPDPARKARIEREAAPLLRTGEPFDYAQLADFRARLRRKYPTAEVLVGKPDEARRQVQVLVRVPRR
jgi:hypothetical protein